MSDGEENSFLLVGMNKEDKVKSRISTINKDYSTTNKLKITEEKNEEKKISKKLSKSRFDQFINRLLSLDKKDKSKNTKKNYQSTEEDFWLFVFFQKKLQEIKVYLSVMKVIMYHQR